MNHNFKDILKSKKKINLKSSEKLNSDEKELLFRKAFDFHSKENIQEAIKFYNLIINSDSTDQALINLGAIYQQKGDFNNAIKLFENLIRLNPNASDALSNYGLLLKDLGQLDKAESLC